MNNEHKYHRKKPMQAPPGHPQNRHGRPPAPSPHGQRGQQSQQNKRKKNISGAKRYDSYLKRDDYKAQQYEKIYGEEKDEEKIAQKGDISAIAFDEALSDDDNLFLHAEDEKSKKARKALLLKKTYVTLACLILSIALNILSFHFPFTPAIIGIDFSAFPELLAGLTINPFIAVVIIVIKNVVYTLLKPTALASVPSKVILDIFYVLVTYLLYKALIKSKRLKDKNNERQQLGLSEKNYSGSVICLSGFLSSIITSAASVVTLKYILLPSLYHFFGDRGYNPESVLKAYQSAFSGMTRILPFITSIIPSLNTLNEGILIYNIPLNLFKYFACALLTSIAYSFTYDFINRK